MNAKSFEEKIKAVDEVSHLIPGIIIIHELFGDNHMSYMSQRGLDILRTTEEDLYPLSANEYHSRYFSAVHGEVFSPKIINLLEKGDENQIVTFFQQVRPSEKEEYKLYLTSGKIFMKDDAGIPTHMISIACPVDEDNHITTKVNRLMEENLFLKQNHEAFATLTNREKEILKCMALGENSDEIAKKLNISEATVTTHRRNIRTKLNINTTYDLVQFAQAFDLI